VLPSQRLSAHCRRCGWLFGFLVDQYLPSERCPCLHPCRGSRSEPLFGHVASTVTIQHAVMETTFSVRSVPGRNSLAPFYNCGYECVCTCRAAMPCSLVGRWCLHLQAERAALWQGPRQAGTHTGTPCGGLCASGPTYGDYDAPLC
jgi:hypothetical protein